MGARQNRLIARVGARYGAVLCFSAYVLCAHDAHATIAGRWRVEGTNTPTEFVVISKVGPDITFTYSGIAFSGTAVNGGFSAFGDGPAGFRCDAMFGVAVRDHERRLYGSLFDVGLGCFGPFQSEIVGERCECFDGNVADGDGCDATCHVEPCVFCTGDPSACVSVEDGGSCNDHLDCTTGETCSGGVCGGGTSVSPCFDLNGSWRWHFDFDEFAISEDLESSLTLVQRDGYLMAFGPSGSIGSNGPIDPSTGTFHTSGNPHNVKDFFGGFCIGGVDGQATAAGESVEGTSQVTAWGATNCAVWGANVTGSRCINGTIEPDEQCDDDNAIVGDGCDLTCRVEPCFACTGSPSICSPLADGTICDDANAETPRSECQSGACVLPPPCPGDCNNDGLVIISELVIGVNIAFGQARVEDCSSIDTNASGAVDIGELTLGVLKLLHGCAE